MMQTGRLFRNGQEYPHYGAALSFLKGEKRIGTKPFAVVPGPIDHTGVIYLIGRDGHYLGFMPPQTAPDRLIEILRKYLAP